MLRKGLAYDDLHLKNQNNRLKHGDLERRKKQRKKENRELLFNSLECQLWWKSMNHDIATR